MTKSANSGLEVKGSAAFRILFKSANPLAEAEREGRVVTVAEPGACL
jgi:hypothetical protein